jgi:transposase
MPYRRTLLEKIAMVRLQSHFRNTNAVIREWRKQFDTPPPERQTILKTNRQFDQTGSVLDRPRSGRPATVVTQENANLVDEKLTNNPQLPGRRASAQLTISRTSYQRLIKELGYKPYIPSRTLALGDGDEDRRMQFCDTWIPKFEVRMASAFARFNGARFFLVGLLTECCLPS